MREFVRQLRAMNPNALVRSVQLLEGETIGETAVLSGGKVVWTSLPDGFCAAHVPELETIEKSGVLAVDGKRVYTEIVGQAQKVVVCGAGYVSIAIVKLCRMLGFHVTVIEDRPYFARQAESAGADRVICEEFDRALESVPGDRDTFFIIVTRGHQYDTVCLRNILKKAYAYVGMMGSRRRVHMVREQLLGEGFSEDAVDSLHAPIGLPIGAETPEEIAVSVMAEIIEVRSRVKSITWPEEIIKCIIGEHHTEPYGGRMILAQIISKKGSAPREAGTKMLFLDDGNSVGTIGGGCAEADVRTAARQMLMEEQSEPRIISVDMTADEAAEEGEVCGGRIQVWMEEVS